MPTGPLLSTIVLALKREDASYAVWYLPVLSASFVVSLGFAAIYRKLAQDPG